ncbi:unnamed protein product, partial [marine sediment metagenome]
HIYHIHHCLSLEANQVLRREGIKKYSGLRPEIKTLIRELLASMENDHILEPAVAYETYSITAVKRSELWLGVKAALHGQLLPSVLAEAKELAAMVCTIGPKLEERVADCFGKNEPLRGLLLDGIGSAAVDTLSQEVCKFMAGEASSRGYQVSSPINPGMPGFPITEQRQMLKLVPAEEIGVSLTSSGVMVPRKSTSMVIGLGPQMTTWTQAEVCARCNLEKTCPYRIHA